MNSVDFIHRFSEFLIKINEIFEENVVDFTFKDKNFCRLFSLNFAG